MMEASELDSTICSAIDRSDVPQLRNLLSDNQKLGPMLRSRWDSLSNFSENLQDIGVRNSKRKLAALRERVQIERHLQAILQILGQPSAPENMRQSMGSQTRHNSTAANFNLSFAASNHNGETRRGHETKEVFVSNTSSRHKTASVSNEVVEVQQGSGYFYKTVACHQGRYWSVYDGATEYSIGSSVYKRFTRDKKSGIFVHRTVSNSIQAAFPKESAFLYKRRVILKVKASGGVRIFGNKLSFEVVKPVAVVCELPRSKEIMNKVLSQMANRSIDQEPISKMYKSLRQSRMMESKGSYR